MAAAEMAAAMSALGAELMKSKSISKLGALKVMGELDLYEDQEALEEDIIADIDSVMEKAQGPDGDRVKYEYAVRQMESRWRLFVGLFDIGDDEPTVEMVKRFCGFMYRTRQMTGAGNDIRFSAPALATLYATPPSRRRPTSSELYGCTKYTTTGWLQRRCLMCSRSRVRVLVLQAPRSVGRARRRERTPGLRVIR